MNLRLLPFLAAGALALAVFSSPLTHANAAVDPTPPPTPPVLATLSPSPAPDASQPPDTSSPAPSPTPLGTMEPMGRHGRHGGAGGGGGAHATPAPPKDTRKGLEGVWEVELQSPAVTTAIYTHMKLKQDANALTGVYLDNAGKQFPLAGSVDGKNIRVVVTLADGSTLVFTAEVDGTTDMLGTMTDAKGNTQYFTAAYRPKENFLDNLSPAPALGGMGGGGQPPV